MFKRQEFIETGKIQLRLFPYVSLCLPSVCIYVILLTRSAESRTRSELRHIDDFYGENLPGMTVNTFSNDAEWSSARMRDVNKNNYTCDACSSTDYAHYQMTSKSERKLINASN